jgi:DNA-binding NtrC family response regulator
MPLTQLLLDEIHIVRREASGGDELHPGRLRTARLAARAARSSGPVLIESEPGTEAVALAHAIHLASDRRDRPVRRFLGETGTGKASTEGSAAAGTLLVEHVEELDPALQTELLRLLKGAEGDPRALRRAARPGPRVIAIASSPLADRVRANRFREDLYYRLQVLPIAIQPLRARRSEIPLLAATFLARFAAEEGKPVRGLTPAALELIQAYDWPGNTRQLENALFRAVVLAEGAELGTAEFPQIAARVGGRPIEIPPVPKAASLPQIGPAAAIEWQDPHALTLVDAAGDLRPLGELEGEIIRFALAHYRGHMSAVSRRLGIGRSTLYRKLKELGLENSERDAAA